MVGIPLAAITSIPISPGTDDGVCGDVCSGVSVVTIHANIGYGVWCLITSSTSVYIYTDEKLS